MEFEPSAAEDPPCRAAMHAKSVESSNVLPLPYAQSHRFGCYVMSSRLVPLKTLCAEGTNARVKYAEPQTSSRWCCGEVRGILAQVSSSSLDHG
ncbi:hypothetical protein TNCV_312621 [Trichonephila clavipes]|nr:hypothetical protein TNCV_312621 [Trichonephila clavipes]